jgi:lipopolysaccharide transport system ATP-binding protein
LQDLNLTIRKGENLGIIGRNGAGKSTLLKILAGVSPATRGDVSIHGRVFPMIELQAGINPDLTGRENIELLGAVMGYGPGEMAERYDAIAEFSELAEWLDRPVRMYSSGMQARLAFSVAINTDADILLIDEVLGVGDYRFQKKCVERLEQLRLCADTTLVFVSHNPYQVQRLCDRVLVLDKGKPIHVADAADTLRLYFANGTESIQSEDEQGSLPLPPVEQRDGSGGLRITAIETFAGEDGAPQSLLTGKPAIFRMHYAVENTVKNPNFGVRIFDSQSTCLLSFNMNNPDVDLVLIREGFVDCRIDSLPLVAGPELLDFIQSAPKVCVSATPDALLSQGGKGVFYCPVSWRFSHDHQVESDRQ